MGTARWGTEGDLQVAKCDLYARRDLRLGARYAAGAIDERQLHALTRSGLAVLRASPGLAGVAGEAHPERKFCLRR